MKMKKVEIEIPEDMQVASSILVERDQTHFGPSGITHGPSILVSLTKRTPRKWTFEEIGGKRFIVKGEYYLNSFGEVYIASSNFKLNDDAQIALRLVEE